MYPEQIVIVMNYIEKLVKGYKPGIKDKKKL